MQSSIQVWENSFKIEHSRQRPRKGPSKQEGKRSEKWYKAETATQETRLRRNPRKDRPACVTLPRLCSLLVRVISCVLKHHDQTNERRKGFICLTRPSLKDDRNSSRTRTWRQKLRQEPWSDAAFLLAPIFTPLCLVCFLIEPKSAYPGMAPPQLAGLSPANHQLRKCLTGLSSA